MTYFQKYLHSVAQETGYVGNIEFQFSKGTNVQVNLDKNLAHCYVAVKTGDMVFSGDDAIDRLDKIDRFKTFGLPASIKISARRLSEEELCFIEHEPFPLCKH